MSNTYKFSSITFTSEFDNGNMGKVFQITPTTVNQKFSFKQSQYEIYTLPDSDQSSHPYPKSFFHFKVDGLIPNITYRFIVRNVNLLWNLYNFQITDFYRPAFKTLQSSWSRIATPAYFFDNLQPLGDGVALDVHFTFVPSVATYFFAFTYPYTYHDNLEFVNQLQDIPGVSISLLTSSLQNRLIHRISIGSGKHIVFVTARVHPGEAPASYAVQGLISFLVSSDERAKQLINLFTFIIIPMLNPDGVFQGRYRTDTENQNLNRYYKNPSQEKQPAVFAVKKLFEEFGKRLLYFFDLHAHGSKKSAFCYGNALDVFIDQIQNVVYAKIVSLNCNAFDFESCNFSKRQMSSKDRFEELSKEGCARVVAQNLTELVHSYTIECGYYFNVDRQLESSVIINCPDVYFNIGESLVISLLDMYEVNSESKVGGILKLKQEVASELSRLERFRHFQSLRQIRKVTETLEEQYGQFAYLDQNFRVRSRGILAIALIIAATAEKQIHLLCFLELVKTYKELAIAAVL